MSLFVIVGFDVKDSAAKRAANRSLHLAHWDALDQAGKIRFGGPLRDEPGENSIGSVIVFEAASLEEARRIAHADPYVKAGVFADLRVHPTKPVYPKQP
ncbi:MAG: YciI family protein [Planctomycetota bacterium]